MMKILLLCIGLLSLPAYSQPATLKGGFAACVSEELFDQLAEAAVSEDKNAWNYLLGNGCIITKAGLSISVLDTSWTGTAKVRAYVGGQAIVLWTNIENIVR